MDFVTVEGDEFTYRGTPITFRGLGIGSWLNMEHFMVGMPGTDHQIREAFSETFSEKQSQAFFDDFVESFASDDDFAYLKSLGINFIRVPFNYRLFIDDENPEVLKETGFRYFDRLFALCRKYEIFCMPDLHAVPGGQNPDWHSDNMTGVPQFWHFDVFQSQIVSLWKTIARHYANEPYLMGYDLLNEPYLMPSRPGALQSFYEKVTAAIREVDTNHVILLEGDFFAMDFSAIKSIADKNTAITFHYYPTVWHPEMVARDYPREQWKRDCEDGFDTMIAKMRAFGRPLLCGEAGYEIAGDEMSHVIAMTEDTLDVFEKNHVSWTLWSYKDAQFMGLVYPKSETPWMAFVDEIHERWNHHLEMDEGKDIVAAVSHMFPGTTSDTTKYELQFRQRALMFVLQKEQILKPQLQRWGWDRVEKMPASFRFSQCNVHKEYAEVISEYARGVRGVHSKTAAHGN
ncbi:MAG: glycoside hydrolase family 5 protein [Bifidobacteriaceae bacterium]|jgi:aryl-phospho-beta-D-glucosidase BglC (GH1 family)|nr:glycoside hydrolase family 5 protein [Bifidobacteriaceae bacterium]